MRTSRNDPPRSHRRGRHEVAVTLAVLLLLAALVALAFVVPQRPRSVSRVAILLDSSVSSTVATRCGDVERIGRSLLAGGAQELQVVVLETGDQRTGNEPVRLGTLVHEPVQRLMEGQQAEAEARTAFLGQLVELCQRSGQRKQSPIFRGTAAALNLLEPEPCRAPGASCLLLVRTDGLEEEDPALVARLEPKRRGKPAAASAPRLDNRHRRVVFCGLSERQTKGRRTLPSIQAIEAAFAAEFTDPTSVSFQPACEAFVPEAPVVGR